MSPAVFSEKNSDIDGLLLSAIQILYYKLGFKSLITLGNFFDK